ncbi:sigma-54 interaction domain-containing protein [Peribacillus muralis]|uniref:sigma-54 interaction domain-containing protein n=1 Tax=Peribacillus muralis TaxID=264697 RepID=UPI001EEDDC11|nr:sigma 54-interacting transcriptional regulator [Peribacillus muralis]
MTENGDEEMKSSVNQFSTQFEWILNVINVGVHIVNKDGDTVFYNEMMAHIDGLAREQVLGENIFQLYPSLTDESSTLQAALDKGIETNESIQTYVNVKEKKITSINSTYPLYEDGKIIGAVEIAKDITKVMNMYDQIVDLRSQLAETYKKNKFLEGTATYHFSDLIGSSPAFKEALSLAKKAARTHSPVMIYGPTGTGKELVAQSIHNVSAHRHQPFIAQNCAAVPKELMEGLLFGTTKGAFTGAVDRLGIFEQANGGTLFLDELNSLDAGLQAKLLRVLQEGEVRRVGGAKEQKINVKIIAAMNISPDEALERGIIRSDLFFRLNVVTIQMPSLLERKTDIAEIADHFVQKFNKSFFSDVRGISQKAMDRLLQYSWPGNIRELGHAIELAFNVMDAGEDMIDEHHLPAYLFPSGKYTPTNGHSLAATLTDKIDLPAVLEEMEKEMIINMFQKYNGNISKTAEALNITRQGLQYKLSKYRIEKVYTAETRDST